MQCSLQLIESPSTSTNIIRCATRNLHLVQRLQKVVMLAKSGASLMASRERLRTLRITFPGCAQKACLWSAAAKVEFYAAGGGSKRNAHELLQRGLEEVGEAGNQGVLELKRTAAELGIVLDCQGQDRQHSGYSKSPIVSRTRKRKQPPISDSGVPRCSLSAPPPPPSPAPAAQVQAQVSQQPPCSNQHRESYGSPTCLRQRRDMCGKRVYFGENHAVEFENGSPPSAMTPVSKEAVALWYPLIESICAQESTTENCMRKGMGTAVMRAMSNVTETGMLPPPPQQQQQEQEQRTKQKQHLDTSYRTACRRLLSTAQQARLRESATERRFLGGWHAQNRVRMTKAQA